MQVAIPIDVILDAAELAREDCQQMGGTPASFARRAMGVHTCINDLDMARSVGDAWFAGRIAMCINSFRERKMPHEMHGAIFLMEAMAATPGLNTPYFKAHAQGVRRGMGQ